MNTHYLPTGDATTSCNLDAWADEVHWTRVPSLVTCADCVGAPAAPVAAVSWAPVAAAHGAHIATYLSSFYPAALPLVANGWTLDSAIDHVMGTCDRELCTGAH